MTKIYRYILVHDNGIAPCPAGGLITLATCKPLIRRTAVPSDWLLGFRPGSHERGLLLWGGRVERVLQHGDYERVHHGRPDALYRKEPDGSFRRMDPSYHPTETEKLRDLAGPVLIFDPAVSRHLGGRAIRLPDEMRHLAAAGRGHRVSGVLDGDHDRVEAWLGSFPTNAAQPNKSASPVRGKCDILGNP